MTILSAARIRPAFRQALPVPADKRVKRSRTPEPDAAELLAQLRTRKTARSVSQLHRMYGKLGELHKLLVEYLDKPPAGPEAGATEDRFLALYADLLCAPPKAPTRKPEEAAPEPQPTGPDRGYDPRHSHDHVRIKGKRPPPKPPPAPKIAPPPAPEPAWEEEVSWGKGAGGHWCGSVGR